MVATLKFAGGSVASQGTPTILNATCALGDVLVLFDIGNYSSTSEHITSVSGLGATWSKIPGGEVVPITAWVGVNPDRTSGNVNVTSSVYLASTARRALVMYAATGAQPVATAVSVTVNPGTATTPPLDVGPGHAVVAIGYSDTASQALEAVTPVDGWGNRASYEIMTARWFGYRPLNVMTAATVTASSTRTAAPASSAVVRVGELDPTPSDPTANTLQVWDGAAWTTRPLHRWDGAAWVPAPLSRFTDTGWTP